MTDPAQLYAQLVAAFNQGRWNEAQLLARQLLPLAPRHPGVYSIAGVACMELNQLGPAIEYLRRAAELDAYRADFATLYAKALSMSDLHGDALRAVDRAIALRPDDPMTLDTLGMICVRAQAHEKATEVFRQAVARSPANAQCRFNLATALITMGEIAAAELELEACITMAPNYWNPHLSLAQLHRQNQARNHVERLQSLLARNDSDIRAQTYLNMALAKEYEDMGEYPRAFGHLKQAKAAGRSGLRYSIEHDENLFELLIRSFPAPQPAPAGDPSNEPIFVVGMPRTGTTLVERILSSHPDVSGAGELRNFAEALQRVTDHPASFISDPAAMAQVHAVDWKRLGSTYISSTRPATGHTPRFVDKLPHNFLFLGFIARALPNARIVCLRRNPMDTCISNFRQLLDQTSSHFGYSFDLLDTGRYYVLFDRLMHHWKRAFPGRILEVGYEDLIEAQETTTRQLLDFCGLPWHEAWLHFEQNPAPVTTLSATQVRMPIYATSVGHWRKYAPQLTDLLALLDSAGVEVDGDR